MGGGWFVVVGGGYFGANYMDGGGGLYYGALGRGGIEQRRAAVARERLPARQRAQRGVAVGADEAEDVAELDAGAGRLAVDALLEPPARGFDRARLPAAHVRRHERLGDAGRAAEHELLHAGRPPVRRRANAGAAEHRSVRQHEADPRRHARAGDRRDVEVRQRDLLARRLGQGPAQLGAVAQGEAHLRDGRAPRGSPPPRSGSRARSRASSGPPRRSARRARAARARPRAACGARRRS